MKDSSARTYDILWGQIQIIKENRNNHEWAMESTFQCINMLRYGGQAIIDDLIDLLTCDNTEVVLLSTLFLGILNESGLNTTKALKPIISIMSPGAPKMIKMACFAALAMLGDSDYIKWRTDSMARMNLTHTSDWNGSFISTVVDYLAGVPLK